MRKQQAKILFQNQSYNIIFTEHAKLQMALRKLEESVVIHIIETGEVKVKEKKNKFWVFKKVDHRNDNLISVSISLESPSLIVITAMVNWRPK